MCYCFTVSTINVTMTTIPNGTLYEETFVDILCDVAIEVVLNTSHTITRQWLVGSTPITAGSEYAITNNILRINQLSRTHDNNRNITCVATFILSSGAQYVQQESIVLTVEGEIPRMCCICTHSLCTYIATRLYRFDFIVIVALSNDLFAPDVIIPGVPTAGDNFNIICRLDGVVESLVGSPVVILSFISPPGGASEDQSKDGSAYIIPRIFNPGMTSDVGTYTCATVITTSMTFISTSSRILQIQSNLSQF